MSKAARDQALKYFQDNRDHYLDELKELIRIPSISFPGFDRAAINVCSETVARMMNVHGLSDVKFLGADSGYPAVFGQRLTDPSKPTLLLYAHYDVQPVGDIERWTTPPFDPAIRDGRLYGRGASDDKGGIMMHLASVSSYLHGHESLPVNVKLLIEGEEEVGSANLEKLLVRYRKMLSADAVIIADSENFDTGIPSLTASLRGLVTVTIEVKSLSASVHSGTWGGPIPDPVMALSKMLASLVDDQGIPAIPGLMDKVRPLSVSQRRELDMLPFEEDIYRQQSRVLDGVSLIGGTGSVYEKLWHRPSVAINAFAASSRKMASNIVNDSAWARVGVRIVPDMDPEESLELLRNHLVKHTPWGVNVDIRPESPGRWWKMDTAGPLFQTAVASLEKGYGKRPVVVGAGGSIPFVQTITETLGGVPALLFGVGDPYAAAHSENESLVIADWENACRSLIHLFADLSN